VNKFIKAIVAGRHYQVEKYVITNPEWVKDSEALRLAVLYNRRHIVQTLLENGADARSSEIPLLVLACRMGYSKITKLLLGQGFRADDQRWIVSETRPLGDVRAPRAWTNQPKVGASFARPLARPTHTPLALRDPFR